LKEVIVSNLLQHPWNDVRVGLTTGVTGKSLFSSNKSKLKITLTRIRPSGKFSSHKDSYHHIFYVLSGELLVTIENQLFELSEGMKIEIPAGKQHFYTNSSEHEALILTMNLPVDY
jgi:quercetin dioxygenase-like cupin family protein